jgi:hypothetical protein
MEISGIGFSHHAKGEVVKKDDIEEVKSIKKVLSVDLVVEPATTRTVFENNNNNRKEQDEMDMKEFTKELTVEKLKESRPDIIEQIEKDIISKTKEEIDSLKAELEKKEKIGIIKESIKKAGLTLEPKVETELVEFLSAKNKEDIEAFFKFYPKGKASSVEMDLQKKLLEGSGTPCEEKEYLEAFKR